MFIENKKVSLSTQYLNKLNFEVNAILHLDKSLLGRYAMHKVSYNFEFSLTILETYRESLTNWKLECERADTSDQ